MMEALRLTASGIIDEVQGIKTTQSGLLERIVAVEARLQNALVGVNKNFVSMANDIEVQRNVINKLVGTMNQWEREQKVLRRDVDEGQRWSQQVENGMMVVLAERCAAAIPSLVQSCTFVGSLRVGFGIVRDPFGVFRGSSWPSRHVG